MRVTANLQLLGSCAPGATFILWVSVHGVPYRFSYMRPLFISLLDETVRATYDARANCLNHFLTTAPHHPSVSTAVPSELARRWQDRTSTRIYEPHAAGRSLIMRDLVVSTYVRVRRHSKIVSSAGRLSPGECVYKIRSVTLHPVENTLRHQDGCSVRSSRFTKASWNISCTWNGIQPLTFMSL